MSAKDWGPQQRIQNTVPTAPLGDRIKGFLIDKATGGLLPRLVLAVLTATAAGIMKFYGAAVEKLPGLAEVVDPRLLVDTASTAVVALLLLLVARWTGKPVRDLQARLREAGVYAGREDGYAGDQTQGAISLAINDRSIVARPGKIINQALER